MTIRRIIFTLLTLLCAMRAPLRAAETNTCLQMTARVLAPRERNVRSAHELELVVTNGCPTEQRLLLDGDDYRILMINTSGAVLISQHYPMAGSNRVAREIISRSVTRIKPGEVIRMNLGLEGHFRKPIPPGAYWVVVTRKVWGWSDQVLIAPAVKIEIKKRTSNK